MGAQSYNHGLNGGGHVTAKYTTVPNINTVERS